MNTLGLIITSPVLAITDATVHAVQITQRPLKSKRKTYDTVCGKRARLLVWPVHGRSDHRMTAAWPPYVTDAREWGYERCRDCMEAAPGKPSRPAFAEGGAA